MASTLSGHASGVPLADFQNRGRIAIGCPVDDARHRILIGGDEPVGPSLLDKPGYIYREERLECQQSHSCSIVTPCEAPVVNMVSFYLFSNI